MSETCEKCRERKAVRYIGSKYVCQRCYYEIKYPNRKETFAWLKE